MLHTHKNLKVLIGTNSYSISNQVLTFLLLFSSLKAIHDHGYQTLAFQILAVNYERKCKVVPVHAMKVYEENRGMAHSFLASTLDGVQWFNPVATELETGLASETDWALW
jgi:lipoprotein signal peptidase